MDKIRGTSVVSQEPGEISQHVGASYVPLKVVRRICGELMKKFNVELKIPGLLFVDTPGHAAFMSLRKRGGSVADLAILVVDVNEGFKEQTDESLEILKTFKVPFVVAATKIDRVAGWYPYENSTFMKSLSLQREEVKEELEKKIYVLVGQLAERGFESERFDRVRDFRKQVAIVPVSGVTGEGIPELLMVLSGLAQQFLIGKLELSETGKGSILEVKETKGFGTTIDVILYDGKIRRGDLLIIGGKKPIVTRVKALLQPPPLRELRVEKKFEVVNEVRASAGVKVAAPNLEGVKAGSPIIVVSDEKKVGEALKLVQQEVEEIEFEKSIEGVIIKADTLGSLEAMIKLLGEENIPIRKAEVGSVSKQDVIEAQAVKDKLKRVVLAFNVKVLPEAQELSKNLRVRIFSNDVIYRLVEEYREWCRSEREKEIREKLESVSRPVELRILKGCVFRVSKPCIVGVEIIAGVLKPGVLLKKKDGRVVGRVKEIQSEGKRLEEARAGDKVAISMDEPVFGRHIKEDEILLSELTPRDVAVLKELQERLTESEKELLREWKVI